MKTAGRKLIYISLVLYGASSYADRTISIVPDSRPDNPSMAGLKLSNPSTVDVTFSLQCYNNSGTALPAQPDSKLKANATLMLGGNQSPGMGGNNMVCGDGTTQYSWGGWTQILAGTPNPNMPNQNQIYGQVVACDVANGISYTNRAQACGAMMHPCALEELNGVWPNNNGVANKTYWLGLNAGDQFGTSTDGGMNYGTASNGLVPLVTAVTTTDPNYQNTNNSNSCRFTNPAYVNQPMGMMYNQANGCAAAPPTGTASGTLCCYYQPDFSQVGMCKVNIKGDGYLQSPSFKGGTPF